MYNWNLGQNAFILCQTIDYLVNLMDRKFSAVVTEGETAFVALCPELGVVSQGKTEKSALANLREAVELYLEDEDVQKMLGGA